MKKAIITGFKDQDGSYLGEFLINRGYIVHGIKSRTSLIKTDRIDHLYRDPHEQDLKNIEFHSGDSVQILKKTFLSLLTISTYLKKNLILQIGRILMKIRLKKFSQIKNCYFKKLQKRGLNSPQLIVEIKLN